MPRIEAPRRDATYSPQERDELYNLVLERGRSKATLQGWARKKAGRSYKAAKRQLELIQLCKEKNSIVMTYAPVDRQWRGGRRFSPVDIWILAKHIKDLVPLARTAVILQRTEEEIFAVANPTGWP
jgi:hypothetical protein